MSTRWRCIDEAESRRRSDQAHLLRDRELRTMRANQVTFADPAALYRLSEFNPDYHFIDDAVMEHRSHFVVRSLITTEIDVAEQPYSDVGKAVAEEGQVLLDGPDGIAIALTPEAAEMTGRELIRAAAEARLQLRES